MKKYKEIKKRVITRVITGMICDKCNKKTDDVMEYQEWLDVHFIGGYYSIFGDGKEMECQLCQNCMKELFGQFLRFLKQYS